SVIRVRVAGVTGPTPASLNRIKTVAEQIELRTHLTVDIVAGSSPAPTTVAVPADKYGTPALLLSEGWVSKGVAVSILNAVDRSSVALFVLILVVCALFVANSATAAVRGAAYRTRGADLPGLDPAPGVRHRARRGDADRPDRGHPRRAAVPAAGRGARAARLPGPRGPGRPGRDGAGARGRRGAGRSGRPGRAGSRGPAAGAGRAPRPPAVRHHRTGRGERAPDARA